MNERHSYERRSGIARLAALPLAMTMVAILTLPSSGEAQETQEIWWDQSDPRIGLSAGWMDAEEAAWNMRLLSNTPRPDGFYDGENLGNLNVANSDLAFQGDLVVVGNFSGFMIYDVSDPANPVLRSSVSCPGGQGDVSIYGDLVFMSVEQTRGRIDCGPEGAPGPVNPERFRGIRIFDISNLDTPQQVAAVQTCRGSHTHTLLEDANDPDHIYVYNSGAAGVRSGDELEGCEPRGPDEVEDLTSLFRIEVIRVPLAAPENAAIVSQPRVFADRATGDVAGLWPGGPHGEDTQRSAPTNHCHDITIYPHLGIAAGACSGNGILFDISDPVNPVRMDEVIDENFAYWHSATFNNDGTTVIFTDEWGGGTSPRCRATDRPEWGANAIFSIRNGRMHRTSYYKLPVPQTDTENCVAHNGSLVPVPGRDIKVQAWYQGGISVFDFTDPSNPFEIAYFDRGPLDDEQLFTGGHWSAYWWNGRIYGAEIARGLDILELEPNEHLTEAELEAAKLVRFHEFNPQHQPYMTWPAEMVVARAFFDQLARHDGLPAQRLAAVRAEMDRAEGLSGTAQRSALSDLAVGLWADARRISTGEASGDEARIRALAGSLLEIAGAASVQ
ncbi:MAG: hypothetical protein EA422_10215 [Gemmatimonadales bacterium]|nr:MAG: hypothetical protein EA422_10215 [Gemmatimonadales bacterium]